jgi:hypothetical protein
LRYFVFIHTLGVAIDQEYLMLGWGQRLEEKHPKMRHEIAGYTIIGIEKQDSHAVLSSSGLVMIRSCARGISLTDGDALLKGSQLSHPDQ